MGGTALSTWLLLLFSTQLKGECSLIWTRGEEKHSGTGIWQEGAGKQREERRGESGQGFAQGGEDGAGLEQGAIVLGEQGAGRGPPRPAELARMWGRFLGPVFPSGSLAGEWEELTVQGCTEGSLQNTRRGKWRLWRLLGR